MPQHTRYTGLIEHYRDRLPVTDETRIISLGEGNTPLVRLENIPREIGSDVELYIKYEGLNPTGSFKDRGMTMAVTRAVDEGSRAVLCASTGNTSAAAAAYAARAGITAFVIIPEGKIALGKLAQAMIHGAVVIQIRGNFDDGMRLVKEVAEHAPVTIVNSINPYRLQGQKTAAFEIVDELGRAPDFHCLPVGNAGNITAVMSGFLKFYETGIIKGLPKIIGVQSAHANPVYRYYREPDSTRRKFVPVTVKPSVAQAAMMLAAYSASAAPVIRWSALSSVTKLFGCFAAVKISAAFSIPTTVSRGACNTSSAACRFAIAGARLTCVTSSTNSLPIRKGRPPRLTSAEPSA